MSSRKQHNKAKARIVPSRAIAKRVLKEAMVSRTGKAKAKKGYVPGLLGSLGGAAGKFFFGSPGEIVGKGVGDFFGKISGMGSYKVNQNSLMTDNGPPIFTHSKDGSIMITHRELFSRVYSSSSFTNGTQNINPGNASLFPWLSRIAINYQEYQFHGLIVEFQSTSADALNSTNTALGTVNIATNYDAVAPAFTSVEQMAAYEYYTFSKPSCSHIHPIECAPNQNVLSRLYVRDPGDVITSSDIRFHDLGKINFATQGSQAVAEVGKFWVSYSITLYKPQLPSLSSLSVVESGHLYSTSKFAVGSGSIFVGPYMLPTASVGYTQSITDQITITPTDYTVSFKRRGPLDSMSGRYHVNIHVYATSPNTGNLDSLRLAGGATRNEYRVDSVTSSDGTVTDVTYSNYYGNGIAAGCRPLGFSQNFGIAPTIATTDIRQDEDLNVIFDCVPNSIGLNNEITIALSGSGLIGRFFESQPTSLVGYCCDVTITKIKHLTSIDFTDAKLQICELQNQLVSLTQKFSLIDAGKFIIKPGQYDTLSAPTNSRSSSTDSFQSIHPNEGDERKEAVSKDNPANYYKTGLQRENLKPSR